MYGIFLGVIFSMGLAGYFYYTNTEEELQYLKNKNMALETAIETQRQTMSEMKEAAQMQAESIATLTQANQEAEAEMSRYMSIFSRHNLTKLAAAKPGLIEKRVNKGTKDVFESIESISRDIDSLDDGVQLAPVQETPARSSDTDKTSKSTDNSAGTT